VEKRPVECECRTCGAKFQGELTTYNFYRPPKEFRTPECPACVAKREAEEKRRLEEALETQRRVLRVKWRMESGLPLHLQNTRFSDLDQTYNPNAQQLCRDWADNFNLDDPKGLPSLVLYSSEPGVGKTTLLACITNYILDNWAGDVADRRCPIRFISGPDLVRRIRATYDIRKDDNIHEREEEVYKELAGRPLLLLDDVGKERASDFTRETYWYIINERLAAGLPVVLNTRLSLQSEGGLKTLMGVDTVDRLYGMCQGKVVEITGTSYRRLHKIP
jgi:DNA replication protein DnaC